MRSTANITTLLLLTLIPLVTRGFLGPAATPSFRQSYSLSPKIILSTSLEPDLNEPNVELNSLQIETGDDPEISLLEWFQAYVSAKYTKLRTTKWFSMDADAEYDEGEQFLIWYEYYTKKTTERYDALIEKLEDYPQVKEDLEPFGQYWKKQNGKLTSYSKEQSQRCQEATDLFRTAVRQVEKALENLINYR